MKGEKNQNVSFQLSKPRKKLPKKLGKKAKKFSNMKVSKISKFFFWSKKQNFWDKKKNNSRKFWGEKGKKIGG